ncbi:hypothetical protein ACVFVO_10580 [Advenella kashmirensis]
MTEQDINEFVTRGQKWHEIQSGLAHLLLVSGIYDLADIPGSFLKYEAKMTDAEAAAWTPLTTRHLDVPRRIVMLAEYDTAPYHDQAQQF